MHLLLAWIIDAVKSRSRKKKLANPPNYAVLGKADDSFRCLLNWGYIDERLKVDTALKDLELRNYKAAIWIEDGEVRLNDYRMRQNEGAHAQ